MHSWLMADLADLKKSTPAQAGELKNSFAGNYFAFPEYAEVLDDINPGLSQEIRPLVDLIQVSDFIAKNMHRDPASVASIAQNASPALKMLLSDTDKMREMDEALAARLTWIDDVYLRKLGAVIASALGRADAAARHQAADAAHAWRLRTRPETDPYHPQRLELEAREVADFIAANHNLAHWKITANIAQMEPALYAILSDANRMRMLDPLVNARLDGLAAIQIAETQAVIANTLERIDAPERNNIASSARAAAGLDDREFDPWPGVDAVVNFVAANHRLAPHAIFEKLALAPEELKGILADRAHLESIETYINQQMPESAALTVASFHEVVALALDRSDARERATAAAAVRYLDAMQSKIDETKIDQVLVFPSKKAQVTESARIAQRQNEQVNAAVQESIASPEHQLIQRQARQISSFVLSNARKSNEAITDALNRASPDLRMLLSNQVRMNELAPLLGKRSGIEPVDLRKIQALLAQNVKAPSPSQPGGHGTPASNPADVGEAQPAPPPRKVANGFRPAGPTPPESPAPASVAGILERITYKTKGDGTVLYSLDGKPAFVDHGDQILMAGDADHDEHAIVAALLVAKEKYGGAFELTGDIEFKRRTIEIMIKYKIDAMLKSPEQDAMRRDILKAKQAEPAQSASPEKTVKPVDLRRLAPPGDAIPGPPDTGAAPPSPPDTQDPTDSYAEPVNRLAGKVLRHGLAPYEHKPRQKMSYFVELENADGRTRTTWGVDLQRVAQKQNLNVGDTVVLQNLGRTPVEVKRDILDEHGKVIGSEMAVSHRNEWEIEVVGRTGTTQERAQAEERDKTDATPKADNASISFVDASTWWAGQHALIQNLAIDYAEMEDDLKRIGPRPSAGQLYWFDDGRPIGPPRNAAQILDQHSSGAKNAAATELSEARLPDGSPANRYPAPAETMVKADVSGVIKLNNPGADKSAVKQEDARQPGASFNHLVMHAISTLPDSSGRYIPSLLLFKSGDGTYLQGFVHIGDQRQHVIAQIANTGTGKADPTIQLSAISMASDGPRWRTIGSGRAMNAGSDGGQIYFDEVRFSIGDSTLVARVNKELGLALHQKLGFEKPQRVRQVDKSTAATAMSEPKPSKTSSANVAPHPPPVQKQKRHRPSARG
jgi:hypothetical protein